MVIGSRGSGGDEKGEFALESSDMWATDTYIQLWAFSLLWAEIHIVSQLFEWIGLPMFTSTRDVQDIQRLFK